MRGWTCHIQTEMPRRRQKDTWLKRYGTLEVRRVTLLARLERLGSAAAEQRLYKTAFNLINQKFRASTVAQRGAVLASADWLISLLEAGTHL